MTSNKLGKILIIIGIPILVLGMLFKIMHWPGSAPGRLIGAVLVGIGIILYYRKKPEDQN